MSSTLCRLTTDDLKQLSAALRSGRLRLPLSAFALRRFISQDLADAVASELQERADNGYSPTQLADLADLIIQEHDLDPHRRASLHAKCIVIDEMQAFISSANFTEAAQLRNIEVGVLVRSAALACQLVQHFETLAAARLLKPIPLG